MSIRLYRNTISAFILSILAIMMISSPVLSTPPSKLVFEPEQNYVITFINYDRGLINLDSISTGLPSFGGNTLSHKINYELQFANESYENSINEYIKDISQPSWTSSLDVEALNEQKANFSRKSIFNQKNGTAIDAQSLENYMSLNPAPTTLKDENRFYLYVFNLSRMDDLNGDHWFNVTEVDPDAKIPRFYWRLEWDYDLGNNFNVRFPYAAYSNSSEVALIDPTAFQWYLTWRAIWNSDTDEHTSYFDDLDHLLNGLSPSGQLNMVTDTVTVWLDDWISKIYNMQFFPEELGTSMNVQMQVMYRGSESTQENLQWIVNDELVKLSVNNLLQSSNIEVTVNFVDLEVDEFMKGLFNGSKVQYSDYQGGSADPFPDWEFYNGEALWAALGTNTNLNNVYFANNAADIVVKGLLYLVDNASYVGASSIPWKGGLYTGLGGSRQITMLYELDRAFMADHTTHKSGLSRVLIHEIGHAIGIPHTFDRQGDPSFDTFTSDFAFDVMGYYPGSANYSQILSKLYQREAADVEIVNLIQNYQINNALKCDSTLEYVTDLFATAIGYYNSRNYLNAYFTILIAELAFDQDTFEPTGSAVSSFSSIQSAKSSQTGIASEPESKTKASRGFQFSFLVLPIAVFVIIKREKSKLQ